MDTDTDFNFENWAKIAADDPEEFERLRKELLNNLIQNSPKEIQNRMQGIQWQIDQIRQTSKTPMAACIKISSMMWDSVLGDNGLIDAIEKLQSTDTSPDSSDTENPINVIHFPGNDDEENNLNS